LTTDQEVLGLNPNRVTKRQKPAAVQRVFCWIQLFFLAAVARSRTKGLKTKRRAAQGGRASCLGIRSAYCIQLLKYKQQDQVEFCNLGSI
jgi:hypothetical protein